MKITVVGLGYVGLSNAVLLAQHNEVIGVDKSQDRVDAINSRRSPIVDDELSFICLIFIFLLCSPRAKFSIIILVFNFFLLFFDTFLLR